MKKISGAWDGVKNYIYKHYGQESGKMLVHAGLITWFTSSLSQVVAVALNKKIDSDQKKFLIPQEIADGAINILTFYMITNSMKNISGKLVSTGKWSTKSIREFVKNKRPDIVMEDINTNLGKTFKEDKEFHQCYDKFKGGMDMIAATTGSVISCNAITPTIRNSWGAQQQKASIAKEKQNSYKSNVYPTNSSMKI